MHSNDEATDCCLSSDNYMSSTTTDEDAKRGDLYRRELYG
jgi:hypothetical protein